MESGDLQQNNFDTSGNPEKQIDLLKETLRKADTFSKTAAAQTGAELLAYIKLKNEYAINALKRELTFNPANEKAKYDILAHEAIILQLNLALDPVRKNEEDFAEENKLQGEKKYIPDRNFTLLKAFLLRQSIADEQNAPDVLPELKGFAMHIKKLNETIPDQAPPVALPPFPPTLK